MRHRRDGEAAPTCSSAEVCAAERPTPPGRWLGEVEAPDETAATEKAAAEFKVPATRLMAILR